MTLPILAKVGTASLVTIYTSAALTLPFVMPLKATLKDENLESKSYTGCICRSNPLIYRVEHF